MVLPSSPAALPSWEDFGFTTLESSGPAGSAGSSAPQSVSSEGQKPPAAVLAFWGALARSPAALCAGLVVPLLQEPRSGVPGPGCGDVGGCLLSPELCRGRSIAGLAVLPGP